MRDDFVTAQLRHSMYVCSLIRSDMRNIARPSEQQLSKALLLIKWFYGGYMPTCCVAVLLPVSRFL